MRVFVTFSQFLFLSFIVMFCCFMRFCFWLIYFGNRVYLRYPTIVSLCCFPNNILGIVYLTFFMFSSL